MSQGESGALPQKEPSPPTAKVLAAIKRLGAALDAADRCGALRYLAQFVDHGGTISDITDAIHAALSSPSHDDSRTDGRRVEQVAGDETP